MDTREAFDALVEARSKHPRGAEATFRSAAMSPMGEGQPPRRRWYVGVVAAAATVVIALAAVVAIGGDGEKEIVVGDVPGDAGVEGVEPTTAPEVFALPSPPAGFELVSASDAGWPSESPGSPGDLTVFQQLRSDGRSAERVLAVGVSRDGEFTVIDNVGPGPGQSTTEQLGGRLVAFGRVGEPGATVPDESGRTIATFGWFDVAQWVDEEGTTFTVATRGLAPGEVRAVVSELISGRAPADLTGVVVSLGEMSPVAADPIRVPAFPIFSSARQHFGSTHGASFTLGTEVGDWPVAADLLWWSAGSVLVDGDRLEVADWMVYRALPGGAAMAAAGSGVPDSTPERAGISVEVLHDAVDGVVGMTRSDWAAVVGDADIQSDDHVATTTTHLAPGQ